MVVIAPGCLVAFWWQLHRALGGNDLSWAYCFEWPIFSVLAVIAWWQMIHQTPLPGLGSAGPDAGSTDSVQPAGPTNPAVEPAPLSPPVLTWRPEDEDEETAAYNRWLAGLASSGRRKTWSGR